MIKEDRSGVCVDISQILSRILEKEGFWNFCFKGSLTINFPIASNISPKYFWAVDFGEFFAGHAWVFAPPFYVIDLAIQQQPYKGTEEKYLPNYIISDEMNDDNAETNDIMSPEMIQHLLKQGVPYDLLLTAVNQEIPDFRTIFPPQSMTINDTYMKYIPTAGFASDGPLENITNMQFQDKSPLQFYQEIIQPRLAEFRNT